MRSHRQEVWFQVPTRRAFINITRDVQAAVRESGIQEGLCRVNAMHITASVFINDDEPGLHRDDERSLEDLAPHGPSTGTITTSPEKTYGDGHLKRQIMGRSVMIAITNAQLDFGPWEQTF